MLRQADPGISIDSHGWGHVTAGVGTVGRHLVDGIQSLSHEHKHPFTIPPSRHALWMSQDRLEDTWIRKCKTYNSQQQAS